MSEVRVTHWAKTHQDSHETEPRRDMELRDSTQDKTWMRQDWAKTCVNMCLETSRNETRVSRLHHCLGLCTTARVCTVICSFSEIRGFPGIYQLCVVYDSTCLSQSMWAERERPICRSALKLFMTSSLRSAPLRSAPRSAPAHPIFCQLTSIPPADDSLVTLT